MDTTWHVLLYSENHRNDFEQIDHIRLYGIRFKMTLILVILHCSTM